MIQTTGILARAEKPDLFESGLMFPLIALGVFAVAGLLVLVLAVLAHSRSHPRSSDIASAAILWGFLMAGSVLYAVNAQLQWSKDRSLMLQSGYVDAYKALEPPAWPWKLWLGLGASYTAMVIYAVRRRPAPPSEVT